MYGRSYQQFVQLEHGLPLFLTAWKETCLPHAAQKALNPKSYIATTLDICICHSCYIWQLRYRWLFQMEHPCEASRTTAKNLVQTVEYGVYDVQLRQNGKNVSVTNSKVAAGEQYCCAASSHAAPGTSPGSVRHCPLVTWNRYSLLAGEEVAVLMRTHQQWSSQRPADSCNSTWV